MICRTQSGCRQVKGSEPGMTFKTFDQTLLEDAYVYIRRSAAYAARGLFEHADGSAAKATKKFAKLLAQREFNARTASARELAEHTLDRICYAFGNGQRPDPAFVGFTPHFASSAPGCSARAWSFTSSAPPVELESMQYGKRVTMTLGGLGAGGRSFQTYEISPPLKDPNTRE